MSVEMKDSGIAWIGEIPRDWNVCRLKNIGELHGRIGWNGLRSDEFEDNSYAYLVTGQDFRSTEIEWNKCYQIRKERYDEDPFIQLENGDILITKDGTIGKIAVVSNMDKPACLNSGIFVLRQKGAFVAKYLFWFLFSPLLKTFNDYMNLGGTTIIHLYQNVFERMPLLIPPIEEQSHIANFLDKKCAEIDELITLQEQMIAQLTTYKQAVITETVTKGLDPNVKTKDSGVEWIGEIPEHWEMSRVGIHHNIILGKMLCNTPSDDSYTLESYYCAANVHFDGVDDTELKKMWFSPKEKTLYKVNENDLLVVEGGAGAGGCAIVTNIKEPIYVQNSIMIVRPKIGNVTYLKYLLESLVKKGYIDIVCNKATIPHFTKDKLSNVPYPVISLSEQQNIANYLDKKCKEIDELISVKKDKIEKLKAYKKSVIYEYVTGKKQVK